MSYYLYYISSFFVKISIDDSINILKKSSKTDFFNLLYKQINKLNFIIFIINRAFSYLDKFFTKANRFVSLNINLFDLYKYFFFTPLQENIYNALKYFFFKENNEINNENNFIVIKKIFKLIKDIDNITNPKTTRINNEIIWENKDGIMKIIIKNLMIGLIIIFSKS